jgi:hypothetical protein
LRDVDIRKHEGVVTEAGNDMTLSVLVESVGDTPIPDVRPESVSPVRWRPAEGDRVVVVERVGPQFQDTAFTWLGLAPDVAAAPIVPGYLEPGRVHIVGEDGIIVLSLEDDADAVTLPDSSSSPTSIVRLGREDADEPLVLGGVLHTKLGLVLDEMVDTAQALKDCAEAVRDGAWTVPPGTFLDSLGFPITGSSAATPPAAALTSVATAAQAVINTINGGGGLRDQLDETYSTYTFTSRDAPRQS